MITTKPIVLTSNRRRDGTYLVFIRVYFAGRCRRVQTSITCGPGDITRSGRIKSQAVLDKAGAIARRMLDSVSSLTDGDLEGRDVDWVVERMKSVERVHNFRLDFFAFAQEYLAGKSPGARCQYVTACHAFADYLGTGEIDINDITRQMLTGFLSWMGRERANKAHKTANKGLSQTKRRRVPNGAESRHIAKLSHIYERAKAMYNDEDAGAIVIPRSPFRGLMLKHPLSHGQDSLGAGLMQRVIDARHHLGTVQTALDCFVMSFALMGANLADLYEAGAGKKLRRGEVWEYQRRKTRGRRADGAQMRVVVPEEISGRLGSLDGLLRMAGKPEFATSKVNKGLARWCEDEGVPVFTFGAARHTWATLARKAGVEKATVDEGLCHVGDFRITDIYAERDWDLINQGNRRVLDLFSW